MLIQEHQYSKPPKIPPKTKLFIKNHTNTIQIKPSILNSKN